VIDTGIACLRVPQGVNWPSGRRAAVKLDNLHEGVSWYLKKFATVLLPCGGVLFIVLRQ
jgi:hypothetical protein